MHCSAWRADIARSNGSPAATRRPRTTRKAPQTKRGSPGLVNPWRTASLNAIATRASLAEPAGTPGEAAAAAAAGTSHHGTSDPPSHAAASASAHSATHSAAGTPGDPASAASSAPAGGAAPAASAPLGKLHAELRRSGGLAVVHKELGEGDVGEFFLSEGDDGKGLLRRCLRAIDDGGRCIARHRQGHAGGSPHRQGRSRTSSLRSLLRACHSRLPVGERSAIRLAPFNRCVTKGGTSARHVLTGAQVFLAPRWRPALSSSRSLQVRIQRRPMRHVDRFRGPLGQIANAFVLGSVGNPPNPPRNPPQFRRGTHHRGWDSCSKRGNCTEEPNCDRAAAGG